MPQRCQRLQTCGTSPDDVVVESVSAAGEVKIGSQFGVGRSLVVVKSISLSLMSSLGLFEQALTITTITATNTSTSTVIATIVTVALVLVFIKEVIVVVVVVLVVEIVGVVAEFMEEVMVVEVVVVAAVVELDVHGVFNIDPEESINMSSFVALEFTQETPQST